MPSASGSWKLPSSVSRSDSASRPPGRSSAAIARRAPRRVLEVVEDEQRDREVERRGQRRVVHRGRRRRPTCPDGRGPRASRAPPRASPSTAPRGRARRRRRRAPARAARSRRRPRPSASSGVSATADRIASATPAADSSPVVGVPLPGPLVERRHRSLRRPRRTRRPGAGRSGARSATICPVRSRIQGFSSRGRSPSSSSSSPIQRPASALSCSSETPATADDPAAVDPLHDPLDVRLAELELGPRIEEVDRVRLVGHGPDRLGEQVEPGGVEAAAERAGARRTGPGRRTPPRRRWRGRGRSPARRPRRGP